MAATIPDDLLIEILSRLPTKSLHRFQCVSHLWFIFITHISAQRTPILPMSGLFFYRDANNHPKDDNPLDLEGFYAPFKDDHDDFKSRLARFPIYPQASVMDSCNGLFLLVDKDWYDHSEMADYYVCNPATNEFFLLPDSPLNKFQLGFLAFDPRDSPHYKVVLFTINDRNTDVIVEMYSSITGTWVMFSRMLSFGYVESHVFHNGALYMITSNQEVLARFDTDQGSFNVTKLPGRESAFEVGRIGKSRGRLYYAAIDLFPPSELRIYMLDEQGADEWLLIHIVSTVKGITHLLYGVIAFHPESEVVCLSIPGKVLSCDPRSGKLEEIWSSQGYIACGAFFVNYCLESLNPPGGRFINPFALDVK